MTDTVEHRVARLERDFVEIRGSLDRIERALAGTRETIAAIRRNIARATGPVAYDAPDGTVAIRDPDIIAQEYRTKMRGHAPDAAALWPPVVQPLD
jgi:hypothetical protein